MVERSPIFSAKMDHQIGYIERYAAFDLSGKRCCNYDERSGNLFDLDSGKVVGHVSLEGKFVGLSWIADGLFPKPAGNINQEILQREGSPNGAGDQVVAGQEPARAGGDTQKSPENHALYPLKQVLVMADEISGQRDAENAHAARNTDEMPSSPLSEQGEPAVLTNSAGERSGPFPHEVERVFELLRDRIGLK